MVSHTTWEWIEGHELPAAQAELAKHVEDVAEVSDIGLMRRLCKLPNGQGFGLTYSDAAALPDHARNYPWLIEGALQAFPRAGTIADVVKLLASPNSPERELARRRALADEHAIRERSEKQQQERRAAEAAAERAKAEKDARDYRLDTWKVLDPWAQAFFTLALRVKDRDPELAADLRAVADRPYAKPGAQLPFPACRWW